MDKVFCGNVHYQQAEKYFKSILSPLDRECGYEVSHYKGTSAFQELVLAFTIFVSLQLAYLFARALDNK